MSLSALPRRVFDGFGFTTRSVSVFVRPQDTEEVARLFLRATEEGRPVAMRGAGRSYGDAALNGGGLILDMTGMDRILAWDPQTGVVDVQPGVTIEKLWRATLRDGWWCPVVPGTMFATLGGIAAMNAHGKNHFRMGGIGDHILEVEFVTPDGQVRALSREQDPALFHAVIGGFGMLGAFTRIRIQMKRVTSGRLSVQQLSIPDMQGQMSWFDQEIGRSDYAVSWMDCIKGGSGLGRGQAHRADYVHNDTPEGQAMLDPDKQDLPGSILGVPRSLVGRILGIFNFNLAMGFLNFGKYMASRLTPTRPYLQGHVAFHFLLDYVPNWRSSYEPGGFIQYQPFLPKETAHDALTELLKLSQARGIVSFLGVLKRYRADSFLLSHALDGYSLAMDFPVTAANRAELWKLCGEMNDIVLSAGGRFYPAKDSVLRPQDFRRAFGQERIAQFRALRHRVDPARVLRTEWAVRVGVDEE